MGGICLRSDSDIAYMRYYLDPLKLKYKCVMTYAYNVPLGIGIWDNFNIPMLNPHRQLCKYGPHLSRLICLIGWMASRVGLLVMDFAADFSANQGSFWPSENLTKTDTSKVNWCRTSSQEKPARTPQHTG